MTSRFPFSNFNRLSTPLLYGGVAYPTTEHFYQAMKTADPLKRKAIAAMRSPADAKKAATLPWQPKFDRLKVMRYALERKFARDTPEAQALVAYTQPLIEWNYWHDTYWGKCTCALHNGEGDNHLGLLCQEIRDTLIAAL